MLLDTRTAWAGMLLAGMTLTCQRAQAVTPACLPHQAAAGDTLIGLSRQHLTPSASWQELARLNHIANPRRIPIGTQLCLPLHLLRGHAVQARVLTVVGEAQLASTAQALRAGDTLPEHSQVQTGPKGYVSIELADGSILQVQPDTQVRLEQAQAHESVGLLRATWELVRGRVTSWVRPQPEPKPRHQVRTPQAVLAVRGTEFRVHATEQLTRAETLSGKVAILPVKAKNAQQVLAADQGLLIDGSTARPQPRSLLAAPDIGDGRRHVEHPLVKLGVGEVPGAQGYRFQVASDPRFQQMLLEASTTEPLLRTSVLPDGELHWRVRAQDAQGLEGRDAAGQLHLNARPEPPIPTTPGRDGRLRSDTLELSWTQHPDGTAYRLQIARDAEFSTASPSLLIDETLTDTRVSRPWPPGRYHWRLATVQRGPDGKPDIGPWGDARQIDLRAAPAALPSPTLTQEALFFQPPMEPGQVIRLQVARDAQFSQVVLDETHRELPVRMPRPQAGGRLHVRYQATDPDGFLGPLSAVQVVELPLCVETGHGGCVQSAAGPLTTH